jgi:hypothetical protein
VISGKLRDPFSRNRKSHRGDGRGESVNRGYRFKSRTVPHRVGE